MKSNTWVAKWMLQPVRHCCKGSIICPTFINSQ